MTDADKNGLIAAARDAGFSVWSEVGKKDPEEDARLTIRDRIAAAERELEAGSEKVVLTEGDVDAWREIATLSPDLGIADRRHPLEHIRSTLAHPQECL
jgi:phosphosulfolactate synthase (CoM biosynthesis protein A)